MHKNDLIAQLEILIENYNKDNSIESNQTISVLRSSIRALKMLSSSIEATGCPDHTTCNECDCCDCDELKYCKCNCAKSIIDIALLR